jgi:large subunit ribosomal protein L15
LVLATESRGNTIGRSTVAEKQLNLHTLKPAQERVDRKRVGRGLGSGKGRYAGRGIKGQKSRAGSHKMRAGFAGGQMPIQMRLGKLRGATSKDAMPIGPFRTYSVPVNIRDLDRFDAGAEVTPESLVQVGLIKNTKTDVKLLGDGEVDKKLTVRVHAISAGAREKIEAAGGTVELLREKKVKKVRRHKAAPTTEASTEETSEETSEETTEATETPEPEGE